MLATTLVWSLNAVAARSAAGEVSPMLFNFLRWLIAAAVLCAIAGRDLVRHRQELVRRWPQVAWMSAVGLTGFNALFYAAAHHTSATHIAIIQGSVPVAILLGAYLLLGTAVRPAQMLGVAITFAGVGFVASGGKWQFLSPGAINVGDLWMGIACILYAGYTLGLRHRPAAVPPVTFFAALALAACAMSAPLALWEYARGALTLPSATGVLLILFAALAHSVFSQLTFMRAVAIVGAGRAGIYLNLVPVGGPLLAMVLLREQLAFHHLAALALVLVGIWVAEGRAAPHVPA